jgi:hypothetical protein
MRRDRNRWNRGVVLAIAGTSLVLALTAGCSSPGPARARAMKPKTLAIEKKHPYSVQIEVAGGRQTDAMDLPQISNQALTQALTKAITDSELFLEVRQSPPADYLLRVDITSLEQPAVGFSMTVHMETAWVLTKTETGSPVLRTPIVSSYTATVGDSIKATSRIKKATEGAARDNIEKGLTKISQLSL